MAIARKGKRQLTVDGQLYLWRVISEFDQTHFDGVQASVSADEGPLYIEYGLGQPQESRHLWVDGRRVPCPLFESDDGVLSSSGVEKLIRWFSNRKTC